MKQLELPKTLRIATIEEIPDTVENREWLKEIKDAKIVQGYTYQTKPTDDSPFEFYCEINIDNSRLWELFSVLICTMPDEISFIYNHVDSEPNFSPYLSRNKLIEILLKYQKEFSQDGLLEFGAIYQDETVLIEAFVKKYKYIQYWGNNLLTFKNIMSEFELNEIKDLNFLDEFPMVTVPLTLVDSTAIQTETLVTQLYAEFR